MRGQSFIIRAVTITVLAVLWGCSGANDGAPALDASGKHPAGWYVAHRAAYRGNPNQCSECHGTDLKGGIAKISCFFPTFNGLTCHFHSAGWGNSSFHGADAKKAPGVSDFSSFNTCKGCHGTDFTGSILSPVGCFSANLNGAGCHGVNAPHPASPWRFGNVTHTNTDASNAPVCASCHLNGANSGFKPSSPPPAGTAPGCFNNTLCHGQAGHAPGWAAFTVHGASAKAAPGGMTGFNFCQNCHASNFTGGTTNVSCFLSNLSGTSCHAVNAPHAPKPWLNAVPNTPTHTTTDRRNSIVCAQCHINGANSDIKPQPPLPPAGTPPDCYNNTLCHFHQLPYANPALHGVTAKADLSVCQRCHGIPGTIRFDGGLVTVACSNCHSFAKAHPTDWQGSGSYSHRTAGVISNTCIICHDVIQGRTPPNPAAPSCFSASFTNGIGQNRSCHPNGPGSAPHSVPFFNHKSNALSANPACFGCHNPSPPGGTAPSCNNCHLKGAPLNTNYQVVLPACSSCHGSPPSGASYPDIAGVHFTHNSITGVTGACNTCHNGAGSGSGAPHYYNRSNNIIDVAFLAAYNAKTGAASYNATTGQCQNISCHGGQTTPPWRTGAINSSVDCTSCHIAGTTQFNSYFSGRHSLHVNSVGLNCTVCHDTTKLASPTPPSHFSGLATPAFELAPSATLRNVVQYNGTTCTPNQAPGNFPIGCHGTQTW